MSAEEEVQHPARLGGLVSGCAWPWEVAYRQAAHPRTPGCRGASVGAGRDHRAAMGGACM